MMLNMNSGHWLKNYKILGETEMKRTVKNLLMEVKMLCECGVHCGVWPVAAGGWRLVAMGKKGKLNFTPAMTFDEIWLCVQLLWK
jgi:hypothetical protein